MQTLSIAIPTWINSLPKAEQGRAKIRFLLRIAAALSTEEGSITALSTRIGFHKNSLNSMLAQGTMDNGVPVNVIKAIEGLIGPGVIPRTLLNPEVYGDL